MSGIIVRAYIAYYMDLEIKLKQSGTETVGLGLNVRLIETMNRVDNLTRSDKGQGHTQRPKSLRHYFVFARYLTEI